MKFKKILISPEDLFQEGPHIFAKLEPFLGPWRAGEISDPDMVGLYLITILSHRFPRNWCLGPRTLPQGITLKEEVKKSSFDLRQLPPSFLTLSPRVAQRLESHPTVMALFASHGLQSLPGEVATTLVQWANQNYSLQLVTHVPSAREVLRLQAQGQRVATMVVKQHQLQHYVIGERDPLGFLVHDLQHAERFFCHSRLFYPQRGFFRMLERLLLQGFFDQFLLSDSEFSEELDYLLADMNAYCVHQLKYLKAILFHVFLRKNAEVTPQDPAYLECLEELYRAMELPSEVLGAARDPRAADDQLLIEQYFAAL